MDDSTSVPACAARCALVTMLIISMARSRGVSEDQMRVMIGVPGEDHRPEPALA